MSPSSREMSEPASLPCEPYDSYPSLRISVSKRLRRAPHRPAAAVQRHAESEARDRWHHDRERVRSVTAMRDRVGERADHVEVVHERARIRVQEKQRRRVRLLRRHVDEMDGLAVDLGQVVGERVHARLLCAPVERGPPVLHGLPRGRSSGRRTPSRRWAAAGAAGCARDAPGGRPGRPAARRRGTDGSRWLRSCS